MISLLTWIGRCLLTRYYLVMKNNGFWLISTAQKHAS